MQITRAASTPRRARPTGSPATSTSTPSPPRRHLDVRRRAVHFTPGARTAWHTHPHGQTIFVTEGVGRCQREGGPVEVIRPGDRVFFEPGENHWHGAAPEPPHGPHRHAADRRDGSPVTWGEHVTDEQYAAAPVSRLLDSVPADETASSQTPARSRRAFPVAWFRTTVRCQRCFRLRGAARCRLSGVLASIPSGYDRATTHAALVVVRGGSATAGASSVE